MAEDDEEAKRSAVRPTVAILTTVAGAAGIALQQLATGQPASLGRWLMLAGGCVLGGAVTVFAAGLFERLLGWVARSWDRWRGHARLGTVIPWLTAALVVVALVIGVPPALDWWQRWQYGCDQPTQLRVLTSTEQLGPTRDLADTYELATAAEHHDCPTVTLYVYAAGRDDARDAVASGWRNDALRRIGPRPDVWLPDASLDEADAKTVAPVYGNASLSIVDEGSLGSSPLVLGVPTVMVPEDLRGLTRNLPWVRLWKESEQRGWDVVRPDPAVSVIGVLATTALYRGLAATGQPLVDPGRARTAEQRIEQALDRGHYPLGPASALICHRQSSNVPPAAIMATEQAIVRFNEGLAVGGGCPITPDGPPAPEAALTIFYPPDTVSVDHPFIRLAGDNPNDPGERAAKDFGAWLRTAAGREALSGTRLRAPPSYELRDQFGADPEVIFDVRPVAHAVTDPVTRLYAQARRPGRILLALDTSKSMQNVVEGSDVSRQEVASRAVSRALTRMSDRDEFGLIAFPRDATGNGYRQLVPIGRGDAPVGGMSRRQAADRALTDLPPPIGATPLYSTIIDGVRAVAADREQQIASLVVVTDGADTGRVPLSDVDGWVRDSGVRVFVVAMGEANCGTAALQQITTAGGGACYDAGPDLVDLVLDKLFALLWGEVETHG